MVLLTSKSIKSVFIERFVNVIKMFIINNLRKNLKMFNCNIIKMNIDFN